MDFSGIAPLVRTVKSMIRRWQSHGDNEKEYLQQLDTRWLYTGGSENTSGFRAIICVASSFRTVII